MAEFRTNALDADRLASFMADLGIVAAIENRGAEGIYVIGELEPSALDSYRDTYIPLSVRDHLQHLRDYRDADPSTITPAQTAHVVKDIIRAVFYLNRALEETT